MVGRVESGAMSYAATPPTTRARMCGGYGTGQYHDDPLTTFGGAGRAEISTKLQKLLNTFAAKGCELPVAGQPSAMSSKAIKRGRQPPWDGSYHHPPSKTRLAVHFRLCGRNQSRLFL